MKEVKEQNLERIVGGFSAWAALGIVSTIIFLAGVLNGFVHPKSCE